MKLYSYIVDHDTGFAPNPFGGFCTLVCCKFKNTGNRRNIVELAEVGDWIIGLGGKSKKSSGHGTLIYAMRVTKKMRLDEYCKSSKFRNRTCTDAQPSPKQDWRRALISKDFYYFGRNAPTLPSSLFAKRNVKRGFKKNFPEGVVQKFIAWIKKQKCGRNGQPCAWKKEQGSPNKKRPCNC